MVILKCKYCGKEFKAKNRKYKYCSEDCKRILGNLRQRDRRREKQSKHTCLMCGEEYIITKDWKNIHLCSEDCIDKVYEEYKEKYDKEYISNKYKICITTLNKGLRDRNIEAKYYVKCPACGKEWLTDRPNRSRGIYCSNECKKESRRLTVKKNNDKSKERKKEWHKKTYSRVTKECVICGKTFNPNGGDKCCSTKCSEKLRQQYKPPTVNIRCDYCGKDFEIISHIVKYHPKHYCSKDCQSKASKEIPPEETSMWKGGWERVKRIYNLYGFQLNNRYSEESLRFDFRRHINKQEGFEPGEFVIHHMYPMRAYPMFAIEEFNAVPMSKELHDEFHKNTGGTCKANNMGIDWVNLLVDFLDKKINKPHH